mmetsp:Transcript_11039/g.33104  ORF Transcript_11039/g.33104 Transcript_11039/m.33104 type:complete len:226 (-) Transcript_11039:49-726(-)|eukprot:CAMPEP_0206142118 /NCGR_PEP_ID=MMETSP1473-20131121/15677_1 /ASSEMBLY_ACC=CAM_ASM_001109 /TAXON_ID=1461547 /ORGANISM="Stichococcus sp, Strain RCC1054" /LENGTH=225 /DNA_ID=CAMNT_0053536983 /DNA_START=187 /DNA_END=864 /DNA_ORIENTATION=-
MPPALEVAVHGTIIATVGTIVIALYNGTLFAWHPILMSLGFLGIMSEGVLTALKFRRLEGPPRAAAIQRHFWIQLLAVTAVAGGFWAIYQNKVIHGKAHFKTTHGKFGLATVVLSAVAPLGGVLSFRKFGLLTLLPEILHAPTKWAHRKVGMVAWLLAVVTIQLGITHPSVARGILTRAWQAAVVMLAVLLLAIAYTEPSERLPQRQGAEVQMRALGDEHLSKTL